MARDCCERVFVYGTLKRGHAAAGLMAGGRYVGLATTRPGFLLVDAGNFPGMVRVAARAGAVVDGEVHDVDARLLARLDGYEGVDEGLYRREEIGIIHADGTSGRAQAYIYRPAWDTLPVVGREWTTAGE